MNDQEISEKFEDHEGRIRTLEKNETILATTLRITNKILGAIAIMIGGSIVTYLFSILTKK
jgi:hypothetical protein